LESPSSQFHGREQLLTTVAQWNVLVFKEILLSLGFNAIRKIAAKPSLGKVSYSRLISSLETSIQSSSPAHRLTESRHAFRRGLASNLNRIGVDDSIIQGILRHSTVSVTQNHYIKTARPDTIAAMRKLSDALLCSPCAPTEASKAPTSGALT